MTFTQDMLNELSEVFPDLTHAQIEVAMMYASGMSVDDISTHRGTSAVNTRKLLRGCVSTMNISSLNSLSGTVQSRLSIFILMLVSRLDKQN